MQRVVNVTFAASLLLRKMRVFLLSEENTHLSLLLAYVLNKYNISRPMTWTSWYPAENAAKNKRLSGDSGSESLLLPLLCLIHKPFGAIIKWNSVTDEPQSSRHL